MANRIDGVLAAPERNRFYYGKLMDEAAFNKEQGYFNYKRRLLNRLVVGSGVVCGLNVESAESSSVVVRSGVALDPVGREIIVARDVTVNPQRLTDDLGNPSGQTLESGAAILCLAYFECPADPAPVLVADCDNPGQCADGTIREEFRIVVRRAEGEPPPPRQCGLGEFPLPPDELRELLSNRITAPCAPISSVPCVPLARVQVETGEIDTVSDRPLVFGNGMIEEMILCLAARVATLTRARILRYSSGDGQRGVVGEPIEPLVVELLDIEGKKIAGQRVKFVVRSGGGSVKPQTAATNAQGFALTTWTLGSAVGSQELEATAAGSPFPVVFRATARRGRRG
jgi:hypothetical protein